MTSSRTWSLRLLVVVALLAATTSAARPSLDTAGTNERALEPARSGSPAAGPATRPVGAPGRWRPVFRDEFDGRRLDLDKWRPNWLASSDRATTKPVNDAELSAYAPRQVRVADGTLRLRVVKRRTRDEQGRRYRFVSGLVQTAHDYRFRYGFAEARLRLEANTDPDLGKVGGCGPNWPAFWLNGEDNPEDGEIDVMECLGAGDVAWHYHWSGGSAAGYPRRWRGAMSGGGGWHTFGVDWRPGRLTFYYDGRKVGTHRRGVARSPHYLVVNHAISGADRRVPSTLEVDYVRVWKRVR